MEISLSYLLATLGILAAVYYFLTRRNGYFHDKPIPSLPVKPLFGSVGDLMMQRVAFSEFLTTNYKKFPSSKVFGMFDMLTPVFVVRDPDLIKLVGVKDFDHFMDHLPVFGNSDIDHPNNITSKSLFVLTGQRWKTIRATLSPAFTGSKMRQMFDLIVECSENAAGFYVEEACEKGPQEYEMKDVFSRFTNDVIATCAFGIKVDSFKDRENEFYQNGKKMMSFNRLSVMLRIAGFQLCPKFMGYLGYDIIDEAQNTYFKSLIMSAIKEREDKGIVRQDMVNLLIQAKKGTLKHQQEKDLQEGFATAQESEVGKSQVSTTMTDTEMVAQCLIFFLAGLDTVSTCLLFTVYELTINPDVQQKLYEEIVETQASLGGKSLTYDAMQKMKYMDMVISEALRIWPPVPMVDRQCIKDYVLDEGNGVKYTIDKGTGLWFPTHALHHDPKYYPNPEKFDPERFSEDRKSSINTGAYLPFGVGPRNCIGSRFALAEVKSILYYMLLNFSFERTSKTEVPPVLTKGLGDVIPANGVHVEFRPRVKSSA